MFSAFLSNKSQEQNFVLHTISAVWRVAREEWGRQGRQEAVRCKVLGVSWSNPLEVWTSHLYINTNIHGWRGCQQVYYGDQRWHSPHTAHSTPGPVDTVEPCTGDKWVSSPGDRRQYQPIYSIRDTIGCQLTGSRWRNLPKWLLDWLPAGAGDCYGTVPRVQTDDHEGKTSVDPDSWTECGVGQSGSPTVTKQWNMDTSVLEREVGGRGRAVLCVSTSVITMLFLFRRGWRVHCTGMGREIIDDKNKVGNLKSMKNIVILWCGVDGRLHVFTQPRHSQNII